MKNVVYVPQNGKKSIGKVRTRLICFLTNFENKKMSKTKPNQQPKKKKEKNTKSCDATEKEKERVHWAVTQTLECLNCLHVQYKVPVQFFFSFPLFLSPTWALPNYFSHGNTFQVDHSNHIKTSTLEFSTKWHLDFLTCEMPRIHLTILDCIPCSFAVVLWLT